MKHALAALSLCVTLFEFEQPVGQAAQGFVNRVTVEWCSAFAPGRYTLVATERLVDGTTGERIGTERKRVVSSEDLPASSPWPEPGPEPSGGAQ